MNSSNDQLPRFRSSCSSAHSTICFATCSGPRATTGRCASATGCVLHAHAPIARKDSGSRLLSGSSTSCQNRGSSSIGFAQSRIAMKTGPPETDRRTDGNTSTNQPLSSLKSVPCATFHFVPRTRTRRHFAESRSSAVSSFLSALVRDFSITTVFRDAKTKSVAKRSTWIFVLGKIEPIPDPA